MKGAISLLLVAVTVASYLLRSRRTPVLASTSMFQGPFMAYPHRSFTDRTAQRRLSIKRTRRGQSTWRPLSCTDRRAQATVRVRATAIGDSFGTIAGGITMVRTEAGNTIVAVMATGA
jgi:hypothetical protein